MSLAYRILRSYRGYILPSHRRTFHEVVRAGALQPGDRARQFVYFDFTDPEIDLDAGRYIFALVREFEITGYTAAYRRNFPFLSNMRYKRYKSLLLERPYRVVDAISDLPKGATAAVVTDRKRFAVPGIKTIRVCYDERLPNSPSETLLPFRPYPKLYPEIPDASKFDLAGHRPWRVFFAGTVNTRYARKILHTKFGKLTRVEILETLPASLRPDEKHELTSENDSTKGHRFFWGAKTYRIPLEHWFPTLAKADFFLACPGGVMPICHNIVEAMAAGAVPILEYAEYLDPTLQDGVNCLTFSGPDELIKTLRRAFKMPQADIQKMRAAVLDYFQKHSTPGIFARDFFASKNPETTLLFNAHLASRTVTR